MPLDAFTGSHQYGDWIFFRYLTENYPKLKGGMPVLLLKIWKSADSVGSGADRYSVQAIQQVLSGKGTSLRDQFATFSAANLFSRTAYDEGTQQSLPTGGARRSAHRSATARPPRPAGRSTTSPRPRCGSPPRARPRARRSP